MFSDRFDMLILKKIKNKKNIILIYFFKKNILNYNYYQNLKQTTHYLYYFSK